jgi:hypothetical protein
MRIPHIRLAAIALLSGVTLGGCAYGLGDPYGGYGGVNVGYGNGYYGSSYGSPYGYGGYGYGSPYGYAGYDSYGYSPYGWYGNYYYPGSGNYVYDRDRRRHNITDEQRRYWHEKFTRARAGTAGTTTATTSRVAPRENWSGFNRGSQRTSTNVDATTNQNRERWRGRSSATTSNNDTTTTTTRTRSDNGWRGRGRSNDQ